MKRFVVYRHRNKINGKIYIGITCRNPKERWGYCGNGYKYNQRFFNSIKHYGWDNFDHDILIHGLTIEQAEIWEQRLIKFYKCNEESFGYNQTSGGSCTRLTEEVKKKISIAHQKEESVQTKLLRHEIGQKIYKDKIAKGYPKECFSHPHTEESKKKLRENNYSKKMKGLHHFNCSPCIRIVDGKVYDSWKQCLADNDVSGHTLNRHLTCKADIPMFLYLQDYNKLSLEQQQELKQLQTKANIYVYKTKSVVLLLDGFVYNSLEDCAKDNYINTRKVLRHCKRAPNNIPRQFMFLKEYEKLSQQARLEHRQNNIDLLKNAQDYNLGGTKIRCNLTGQVYLSINSCCKIVGIVKSDLLDICKMKDINQSYMYLTDYLYQNIPEMKDINAPKLSFDLKTLNTRKRSIIDLRDGKIYKSVKDCCEHVTEGQNSVIEQCKNKRVYQDFMYLEEYNKIRR